jgi:hypothetical protein
MQVTIETDAKWIRLLRSPVNVIVSALTGASVSFAAPSLYWSGQGMLFGYEWIVVPL